MLKTMLSEMKKRSRAALEKRWSPRFFWFSQWAETMLRAFEKDMPTVFTTYYTFPMEILAAFDVAHFDFELAASMLASTELAEPLLVRADDLGYDTDICSFHRASMGAHDMSLYPESKLFLTTSSFCNGKWKVNEVLSRSMNAEPYLVSIPQDMSVESIRYVATQLREAAEKISVVSGQAFDIDRLREALRISNQARTAHLRMLECLKHRPAPWGGIQLMQYSIFSRMFAGTKTQKTIHEAFADALGERIESGTLRPESRRLYWFAWVPTYQTNIFDTFARYETAVVHFETLNVFWDELDERNPFESLALKCLQDPFQGPTEHRLSGLSGLFEDFSIDGAVLFATPGCRHSSGAYGIIRDAVVDQGRPFLMLDVDIGDPRKYAPEQTGIRLEGFMELLHNNERAFPS
ncbi:MAG: 2-hydroxyacyl-CoA dehydratase [Deltaproteobacteria bacterium]|nr:2-hydroxyacyl-CoA dehydratase [Candidatus Zymogenaceae bacterium]